ncbi:unnamed protein product [Closterium sp. Naga37s-1]|nr:unnamed protein product [Closterium sp. Naga37s-1]
MILFDMTNVISPTMLIPSLFHCPRSLPMLPAPSLAQLIGVEPKESAGISGGKPGPHKIQGIGRLKTHWSGLHSEGSGCDLFQTKVIQVSSDDSVEMAKQLAVKEGLLVGAGR